MIHLEGRTADDVLIDAVKDLRELIKIKIQAGTTGLFMVGGGVLKNFAQDTVVCAEATTVVSLIVSEAYHQGTWKK